MESILSWVLIGICILLVLIPFLLGMMIPAHQQATRVELIKAPLDKVWEAISELSRQTEWRTDLKSVQLKDDDDGMRWIETPARGGKVTLRKVKEVEKKELLIQMERGSTVQGTRSAVLAAVPGGTRITFTQTSELKNPIGRLFAQLSSRLDKHLNHYIDQLKKAFDK
ncbi:MAG: SRPBCC family protein [Thiolinea sp.]